MRRYESVIILDPDMPDDDVRAFTERYTELIKSYGGDVIKADDWGLKKLAYLVKKREKGRYVFFDYAGVPALLDEMERQFKISEDVIKFLSIKLDSEIDLEALKAEAEAKAKEAAASKVAAVEEPPAPEAPTGQEPAVAASEEASANEPSSGESVDQPTQVAAQTEQPEESQAGEPEKKEELT